MFSSLLIANRGEIAVRIARTARAMGLRTIAVFSDADRDAPHVRACDEAWPIGPAPAAESYLVAERILEVARRAGAEAIHPGYGFLSENAGFAEACATAGIAFVGPPAGAIEAMGSKAGAKALMEKAGVPLVPGYHGDDQSVERLSAAARDIGFPVLLKASAGGGGKGMRVVRGADELKAAIEGAQREGKASFGDDRLIVEKYLERPRHVEVQVFADSHGNTVHLFERDCSAQRRHQKILEEAPAPDLDPDLRREMGASAVAAAEAVGYVGAGTVEFIMDSSGSFHFMEMNTRLQVEHPVTELITGLDLVALQLRVAAGEALPFGQDDLSITGHAVEVRLYAEDPARDFMPQTGRLVHLRFPEGEGVRVDSGVEQGGVVSVHYDPMIAKVIAHGADRRQALARLAAALGRTEVVGVTTNRDFLKTLVEHPEVVAGPIDTGFVGREIDSLAPPPPAAPDGVLALAGLAEMRALAAAASARAAATGDPQSPWARADAWRLNDRAHHTLRFRQGEDEVAVDMHADRVGWRADIAGRSVSIAADDGPDGALLATIDRVRRPVRVVADRDRRTVLAEGRSWTMVLVDPLAGIDDAAEAGGRLVAPMPAKVASVAVSEGDAVKKGTTLIVLEAMKMEHTISAPADGTVAGLPVAAGDLVEEGADLVVFEADGDKPEKGA
ncbi:acetyl/propionyl/methylcrotonyl-CoA carboxylase subunit alpha [Thalassobaculum litoreum]|uniref:3-methylcrotonyl-CoA carboxylase alpha subunit n=1 Tax=Thalassobaculum litoreum DSM 18839 TaxID=1123362 RepID=A0A8G2BKL6_9PROT|nr:acetyl/propionyl/methylcrotonyl-CoA carboxylase subunit alpha [Thalassobaculum litoreum]SDG26103.1 3-methylcrotonyl-CoA carboxylase alpha subunit [Thalassobaculum litoreum DSM 18839]